MTDPATSAQLAEAVELLRVAEQHIDYGPGSGWNTEQIDALIKRIDAFLARYDQQECTCACGFCAQSSDAMDYNRHLAADCHVGQPEPAAKPRRTVKCIALGEYCSHAEPHEPKAECRHHHNCQPVEEGGEG